MDCCNAHNARHCECLWPRVRSQGQLRLPEMYVPHYESGANCYMCQWVRETQYPVLRSRVPSNFRIHELVANTSYHRIRQRQRQRLLSPVKREKFQILYIYAIQTDSGEWGWVVVLSKAFLPFLLTDKKYLRVVRFARHPTKGWFGITAKGLHVEMPQVMAPPLFNPLYKHWGYDPACSPYRVHGSVTDGQTNASTLAEEDGAVVVDPCCANPPAKEDEANPDCELGGGRYYGERDQDRHTDWRNTTVFVGCLPGHVSDDGLRYWFQGFGELLHVKKMPDETCGFVQFADRRTAEMAITQMQGFPIHGSRVRLSWGDCRMRMDQKSRVAHMIAGNGAAMLLPPSQPWY